MERFIDFISKERANAYKVNDIDSNQDILNRYLYNIDLGKSFVSIDCDNPIIAFIGVLIS